MNSWTPNAHLKLEQFDLDVVPRVVNYIIQRYTTRGTTHNLTSIALIFIHLGRLLTKIFKIHTTRG